MTDIPCDAAIIGGGLAGCSAAIALAQQGWRVMLFESKTYPHHKVCGEFLSPECAYLLDGLGLTPALQALHPARIDSARITTSDGTLWETRLPGRAVGLSRYTLDHALAEHARTVGVTLHEGTKVTAIGGGLAAGFSLDVRSTNGQMRIQSRLVIAAHGKRSSLDRALNRAFLRQPQPFVGLKMHFNGMPIPRRVELHTFPGGYCGLSAVEGGIINACLLVQQDVFQRAGGAIPTFIAWMRRQNPHLDTWLATATPLFERWLSISQIPFVDKPPVERDILMAGDSAGLIAPLAGDGMSMALGGGLLAARCASDFLAGWSSTDALRWGYSRAWKQQFGERLRLGRLLQAVMLRPALLSWGLRAVQTLPSLGTYFVARTRDRTPVTM